MAKKKEELAHIDEATDAANAVGEGDDPLYDPDLEARREAAASAESATMKALQERQKQGCTMPDKLLCADTVGSVPPGTTGYIDPYFVGVDENKRVYLYAGAPLSREPARSGPALIKVMRTHAGWTVYALGFVHYRWTPNAVLWRFATDSDIIPVLQLQA